MKSKKGNRSRLLCLVLAVLMIISTMPFTIYAQGYEKPPQDEDGTYEIANADQLYWFAERVNSGDIGINGVLTADIVVNEGVMSADTDPDTVRSWTPISSGTSYVDAYDGCFDGQGHTISGLFFDSDSEDNVITGLFKGANKNAVISNLGVVNSYFRGKTSYDFYIGIICAHNYGTIKNCFAADVGIDGEYSWSCQGGIAGFNDGGTVQNCYYPDTMSGIEMNYGTAENVEGKTAEQFASGEVAYLLGGAFGQSIGTDKYPVFGGEKVYRYENITLCDGTFADVYYSNDIITTSVVPHKFVDGFCTVCGAYEEPTLNEDGVYEIAKAAHLYWFAERVNSGDYAINGVLTADIVVNEGTISADTDPDTVRGWTPIGTFADKYNGNFDGQGHTVSGLFCSIDEHSGLFGGIGTEAVVSNLGVVNSYFRGGTNAYVYVGGVCAANAGTVKNCYAADISLEGGIGWQGAVVGFNNGLTENCFINGTITSSRFKAVVYENKATVRNCYYPDTMLGIVSNTLATAENVESKTAEQFASGEVAYLLGDAFGQSIGTDSYPVLGGEKVYRYENVTLCDGSAADVYYSNDIITDSAVIHNFVNGFCTVCGAYEEPPLDEDGVYEIANAGQLMRFAERVNSGDTAINAVLTADIVVNDGTISADTDPNTVRSWTPIGNYVNDILYNGSFDGQGHTISGLFYDVVGGDTDIYAGLFGVTGTNAVISNLGVVNSYFRVGGTNSILVGAGGICNINEGTIKNCYIDDFEINKEYGDIAGIAVINWHGIIENCFCTDTCNCDYLIDTNAGTVKNCYYTDTISYLRIRYNWATEENVEQKTAEQFAGGEVAYLLGDAFGQSIGTDSYPVLDGEKVYLINNQYCDGTADGTVYYSNDSNALPIILHSFADGVCTLCGAYEDGFGARLAGYTLSLEGNIGVNFHMLLDDSVASSSTAYMQFILPDGSTQQIYVLDAEKAVVNGKEYYVFSCQVPAKNMTDTITAQMFDGQRAGTVYTYTVKEYAEYLLAHQEDNAEYAKAAPLVKAMLNYGSYAQIYFGYTANGLANDSVYITEEEKDVSSVTAEMLEQYRYERDSLAENEFVRFEGSSLLLRSQTTLRLWFTIKDENYGPYDFHYGTTDGSYPIPVQSGAYYYVDIDNIHAKDLDENFWFGIYKHITEPDKQYFITMEVSFSPMAYCYDVLSRETTATRTQELKDTVAALYLYNVQANNYFEQ